MSVIDFNVEHSDELPSKPLGEVEKDLVSATVGFNQGLPPLVGVTFKLSASANGKIEAYNDESDKDEDGVLGKEKKDEDAFGPVVLPPQIDLNNESAWLKYRFQASAGISAEAKVAKNLGFKIDANKKVVFADYRIHGRGENTIAAITGDVTKLRFTGSADDAFNLAANEALYYQLRGEFSAKVSLSWSDVFTFGLSEIASVLQNSELLMIKVAPSASIDFHVGVVDDFRLVLTKGNANKVRVSLKKGKSDEVGVSAGFQVAVQFADEEKAKEFLDAIYEATLGQPLSKIKELLNQPESQLNTLISNLPAQSKKLVEFVLARLKISDGLQTLKDFKEQIEAFEKRIKETIEKVAKAKVELSFKYEYLRVSTDDTLFVVQLTKETFKSFHNDLMLCDFIDLLDWARKDENKNAVERFLNQKTLTTTESWGFTLGVAKWQISGKDEKEKKAIIQEDINGDKRIAYRFLRGYKADFGEKFSWVVDFKAEMNKFSASPTTCDFEYGLNFTRSFEGKFSKKDLRRVFDDALIWQGITLSGLTKAVGEIEADGFLDKKGKAVTQFTIKDSTLRKLLPFAASEDNDGLTASALAMAMVYDDRFPTRKDSLNDRERAYASLWKTYFSQPNLDINSYVTMASNFIRSRSELQDELDLADFEKGVGLSNQPVFVMRPETFAGTIHLLRKSNENSAINDFRKRFIKGLLNLHEVTKQCRPHENLTPIYLDLRPFFTQSLFVRAAGVYLIRLAAKNGLLGEINRSCTVAYTDKTFIFNKAG